MGKVAHSIFDELYEKYRLLETDKNKFYLIIKDALENEEKDGLKNLLNMCLASLNIYSKNLFINGKFVDCIDKYLKNNKKININDFVLIENVLTLADYNPDYEECIKVLKITESFIKKIVKSDKEIEYSFLSSLIDLYKLNNSMIEAEEIKDLDKIFVEDDLLYTPDDVKAYLKEISRYPLLSASEERKLLVEYKNGDMNAYKDLINSNLRLVVYIARRYKKRGLNFLDLIQEGNIGLMKGIERFDITKNVKLISYVSYWVKCYIVKAIKEKGRLIRISNTKYEMIAKYKKDIGKLAQKLGRKPEVGEILSNLNISMDTYNELNELMLDTVSLNKKIDPNEETELGSFIENKTVDIEEEIVCNDFKNKVKIALIDSDLTTREIEVIECIFDLNGNGKEYKTMVQIGKDLNVTSERIRQIRDSALEKLKDSIQMKMLYENEDEININEVGKYTHLRDLYILLNNYSIDLIDVALNYLSSKEHEILNIRYSKTEKEILKNPLTIEEREAVLKVKTKLVRIIEKIKKGTFNVRIDSSEYYKEQKIRKKSLMLSSVS